MKLNEFKQIANAFYDQSALKVEHVEEIEDYAVRVTTKFLDRNGLAFRFYAYRRPKAKLLVLTDAGEIAETLKRSGMELQMGLLQSLLRSYGLTLTQEGAVVEMTRRPLGERIAAMFQAWAAADGVMRMWTRPKEK